MIFWLLAGVMTVAAAALLLVPLARRRRDAAARDAYDLEVYRNQLAEIAEDAEQGLLTEEQAATARLEIERRILASARTDRERPPAAADTGRWRRGPLIAIALAAPAAALVLYLFLGEPGMPGQPFVEPPADHPAAGGDMVQVRARVAQLAARLEDDPQDLDGWRMLGRSYMVLGRYDEAVQAWTRAAALDPGDARLAAASGEAMVKASEGRVTPEARRAFEAALALDAQEPGARFYIGLADAQEGRLRPALGKWEELAADLPAETPWLARLRKYIAALKEDLAGGAGAAPPGAMGGGD